MIVLNLVLSVLALGAVTAAWAAVKKHHHS